MRGLAWGVGWSLAVGLVCAQVAVEGGGGEEVVGMSEARQTAARDRFLTYETGRGQWRILAPDGVSGGAAMQLGRELWRQLERPLGLPKDGFSSAILVQLVLPDQWMGEAGGHRVTVDPGGLVSVWVGLGPEATERGVTRALVEGLVMRLAVWRHGATESVVAPAWLVEGAALWAETRAQPAWADEWRRQARGLRPPRLEAILNWDGKDDEATRVASYAVWVWLVGDSGMSQRWSQMLRLMLGGEGPGAALRTYYGQGWRDWTEQELAWQVTYHDQVTRTEAGPWGVVETRDWLRDLSRVVKYDRETEAERTLEFGDYGEVRREVILAMVIASRLQLLQARLPRLHPFYHNAGLSLAQAWALWLEGRGAEFDSAAVMFVVDALAGRELEDASHVLLERGHE